VGKPLWRRWAELYSMGLLLLGAAWILAWNLLAPGSVRLPGSHLLIPGYAGTPLAEAARIFLLNLVSFLVILLANRILRVREFGYGSLVVLAWMVLYGLLLGTGSFGAGGSPLPPGLHVVFRSGVWELGAGALFAVSTWRVARHMSADLRTPSRPVSRQERGNLTRQEVAGIILSLIVLAAAAGREAWMIRGLY